MNGVKKTTGKCAFGVTLTALLGVATLPIYWMVITSLRGKSITLTWPPVLTPDLSELSFDTYAYLFAETHLGGWLMNSIIVATVSTLLTLVVAVSAGYGLSRSRAFVCRGMGYVVLTAKMLPGTLLVIPLYVMFYRVGLIDTLFAVILGNMSFAIPFATWMMKGFFDSIPIELEEAALVDGDTPMTALIRIVLPLTLPALAAVTVYVFIVSWNDFIFARTFLAGGDRTTITVGATQFLTEVEMEWNRVMAVAVVATIPVAALFFRMERYFVSGLVRGYQ